MRGRVFTRSSIEVEKFVAAHRDFNNIYFGVCTRKLGSTSGKKEDVFEAVAYWADMDFKDYGQTVGCPIDLNVGEEVARKKLSEFPFAPSLVVKTGGGLHVYWLFTKPISISSVEHFESVLKGICNQLNADPSAADIAKMLRLPNTINFPNKVKIEKHGRTTPLPATIEYINEIRYEPTVFNSFYQSGKNLKTTTASQKIAIVPFESVQEKFNKALQVDFALEAIWRGNRTDLQDQSRSGHDMCLANRLAKTGFNPEECKAILKAFPFGKGKDGKEGYYDRTVSKAFGSRDKGPATHGMPISSQGTNIDVAFNEIYSELNKDPCLIEISEVEESEPIFLIKPYILGDALTILAGDGGSGKSQITLEYSARVSDFGNVCIFSNEDKPGTIKKRLKNQGANMSKISLCTKAIDLSSEEGQKIILEFLNEKKPSLTIIDSLSSYSGDKDLNKSTDVRRILNFLNEAARYFECAILVIMHLNKGDGKSIYKISGSTQIVAAARSVLLAGCKPKSNDEIDEDSVGAMFHVKANESKKGKPLGYTLGEYGLRWVETNLKLADIMASDTTPTSGTPALNEAMDFLVERLKNGPRKIGDIRSEAKEYGIAPITLRRAVEKLKIKNKKLCSDGGRWSCPGLVDTKTLSG